MGLSDKTQKSTQSSQTQNQYGYQPGASSPDIDALRNTKFNIDPSIGYRLGEKERQLNESLADPTGGYMTPAIRDAIERSGQRELASQAGQQTREGAFDVNKLNYSKNLATADLTKPVLTQTGSTSSGSGKTVQSESPWGTIAQVGASVAPLSL